jgi:hypothetical protein
LADEDPETENIAADEGLVLSSRAGRLLDDASYTLGKHRRYFIQMRSDEDQEEDDDA